MSDRLDFPKPYRGQVDRPAPVVSLGPVAPWAATVTVTPLTIDGYAEVRWEILARWHGPPLPGTPTPRPGQKVHARDTFMTGDREAAQKVAGRALEQLRAGVVPDLRKLHREVLRRASPDPSRAPAPNLQ